MRMVDKKVTRDVIFMLNVDDRFISIIYWILNLSEYGFDILFTAVFFNRISMKTQ